MRTAIFSKTFQRPTLERICEAIRDHGFRETHFNLASAGLESLPEELSTSTCRRIAQVVASHDVNLCSVSGTFNAIQPDKALRAELTRRACQLIERCQDLGVGLVSLCTGTRCERDMWTKHPGNQDPEAWSDLCQTVDVLLNTAARSDVVLGVEPELANVMDSAEQARRLLDFFKTPHLKIVIDGANLIHPDDVGRIRSVFDKAFDLLGPDVVMAHAKDLSRQPGGSRAAGAGLLDWDYYLECLRRIGFTGPLVLHGMEEAEVADSLRFLKNLDCRLPDDAASSPTKDQP